MVFHKPRKRLPTLNISIDNENVERCISFNYLGIHLNQNLTWNDHIKRTSLKIARATGRINCLKHFLSKKVLLTLYSLILPHLTYGILACGAKSNDIAKLQKKSMRIITASKYNAHTEPLFKAHHLLKIEDIYKVYQLNFYFKWKNGNLPKYFNSFCCNINRDTHSNHTRTTLTVPARVNHEFAKHSLRHSLIILLNQTLNIITDKITTHSFHGFSSYVKNYYINTYTNLVNKTIADSAMNAFGRHFWYLTGEMVPLALFSNRVPDEERQLLGSRLLSIKPEVPAMPSSRYDTGFGKPAFPIMTESTSLADLVTPDSWWIFKLLNLDSSFLEHNVTKWQELASYQACLAAVKCLNDAAERGVKLSSDFLSAARNEENYQSVIQVVQQNRKDLPNLRQAKRVPEED
ncbi:hypothetical protein CAPTEDRAFT_188638 [Capitella teleta]|uniref:Uncharacterized protein n=1 Tax=Capitella teleta TaxID=283909 RepID=R7V7V7_CAPTE|nr:hypothetical protein CAPTEDRAFT_188638 [Capitella teleta]|eukprot:ELU11830.1 hypothetical protein CAPTEDRAFT_188638 [Capitella teleta]